MFSMKQMTVVLFIVAATFMLPNTSQAIEISTTSYAAAPFCCLSSSATFIHSVSVTNPEPAWHAQEITFKRSSQLYSCSPGGFSDISFCCITINGNSSTYSVFSSNAPCPLSLSAHTFASVGGYGLLPFHWHSSSSPCRNPCLPPNDCQ